MKIYSQFKRDVEDGNLSAQKVKELWQLLYYSGTIEDETRAILFQDFEKVCDEWFASVENRRLGDWLEKLYAKS